ncbi:cyclic GMP-AMP synthase [Menidia menidia]
MTGKGRPRKAKSPEPKLPQEIKQRSPERCRVLTKDKLDKTTKKKAEDKSAGTVEKPPVENREGKNTNHLTEDKSEQQGLPTGSRAAKTHSTKNKPAKKSAGETTNTTTDGQNDPLSSGSLTKTKEKKGREKLPEDSKETVLTRPKTSEDATDKCSNAIKLFSDENDMQPDPPKAVKKASVKETKACGTKAKKRAHLATDTKTVEEQTAEETKKPMTAEGTSKDEKSPAKAEQMTTKVQPETFEDTDTKKVNSFLKSTLEKLKIRMGERSEAATAVNKVVKHIVEHFKQKTECFKDVGKPVCTGSYYENVKISHPDEFDVMLPMLVERVQIDPFREEGAFYSVGLKRGQNPLSKFQKDDILSASEMLQEFREEVKKCLVEFKEWTVSRKKKGCPAVTITTDIHAGISLDVVLCLKVKSSWPDFTTDGLKIEGWLGTKVRAALRRQPYYLVPKYEGRGTAENNGVLAKDAWRISFSHIEKAILSNHGSEKTCCERSGVNCCRKDCLKLLKYLLHLLKSNQSFDKFCSYHAKTTLFHACSTRTKDSDWRASDLSSCFNLLLQDFEKHLETGILPNFFIPTQNLLSNTEEKKRKHLAKLIKAERENGFPHFRET